MENFQEDGGRVADFSSTFIKSVGFVCQSLPFGRIVLWMINLLRVLWSIAVKFLLVLCY